MKHVIAHYAPIVKAPFTWTDAPIREDHGKFAAAILKAVQCIYQATAEKESHWGISNTSWFPHYVEAMQTNGYTVLGNGHFAVAFSCPDGQVVKVGCRKEDSGAAYAAFCRSMRDTTHAAFVSEVQDIQRFAHCYTVIMPKYARYNGTVAQLANGDTFEAIEAFKLECQYALADRFVDGVESLAGFSADELMAEILAGTYYRDAGKAINYQKALAFCGGWRSGSDIKIALWSFAETCVKIRAHFEGVATFDLHSGNVMVKHNSRTNTYNLVITDPVSFSAED